MTPMTHKILIDRSLADVYRLAQQVEQYPEFLPGYLESRVIEKQNDQWLLLRRARVRGKIHEWRSWVRFEPNHAIHFEHAAGPLKGTIVDWIFLSIEAQKTQLLIRHHLQVYRRGLVGWLVEKIFFAPRIEQLAADVVIAFKQACETQGELP